MFSFFILPMLVIASVAAESANTRDRRRTCPVGLIKELIKESVSDYLDANGFMEEIKDVKAEFEHFKNEIIEKVSNMGNKTNGQTIAFSLHLAVDISTDSALKFQRIITNIGGGYHKKDGKFHCPKAGVYLFSVTLQGFDKNNVMGHIMKNNKEQAIAYSALSTNRNYVSASTSLALRLDVGDTVWVKGESGMKYHNPCYFTGVYINQ